MTINTARINLTITWLNCRITEREIRSHVLARLHNADITGHSWLNILPVILADSGFPDLVSTAISELHVTPDVAALTPAQLAAELSGCAWATA